MKRILSICLTLCCVLCMTGCEEDLEKAAYEANKTITGAGDILGKPDRILNSIVDDFVNQ